MTRRDDGGAAWRQQVRHPTTDGDGAVPSPDQLALERVYDLATRVLTSQNLIGTRHGNLVLNILASFLRFEREERAESVGREDARRPPARAPTRGRRRR